MRPCYSAILNHAAGGKPAIVFVPTRKHVRLTALDLLTSAAADGAQHRCVCLKQEVVYPCSNKHLKRLHICMSVSFCNRRHSLCVRFSLYLAFASSGSGGQQRRTWLPTSAQLAATEIAPLMFTRAANMDESALRSMLPVLVLTDDEMALCAPLPYVFPGSGWQQRPTWRPTSAA
jgi:hypothetical protein